MFTDGFLGEIRTFAFAATPDNWLPCDGRMVQIRQYPALFSVTGIAFGGDGMSTFGLPDLRGKVPVHRQNYSLGERHPMSPPNEAFAASQGLLAFNICICFDGVFPPRQ